MIEYVLSPSGSCLATSYHASQLGCRSRIWSLDHKGSLQPTCKISSFSLFRNIWSDCIYGSHIANRFVRPGLPLKIELPSFSNLYSFLVCGNKLNKSRINFLWEGVMPLDVTRSVLLLLIQSLSFSTTNTFSSSVILLTVNIIPWTLFRKPGWRSWDPSSHSSMRSWPRDQVRVGRWRSARQVGSFLRHRPQRIRLPPIEPNDQVLQQVHHGGLCLHVAPIFLLEVTFAVMVRSVTGRGYHMMRPHRMTSFILPFYVLSTFFYLPRLLGIIKNEEYITS